MPQSTIVWFIQPVRTIHLAFSFFFFFADVVCDFLSFPLNIYYLYVHMQFHRLNKFL